MVALVRPLIADPECVNKYRCGREAVVDELKDVIPDTRIMVRYNKQDGCISTE